MFGMTMAFAAAGIVQTYLERIMGLGFLETQLKIQVHFLMVIGAGTIFTVGVGLFLWDFFRYPPLRAPVLGEPSEAALAPTSA
jgi:nitric oxide reductase subunit B